MLFVFRWDAIQSAVAGDYIIAVSSKLLAQMRNDEVVKVLAQVLADLVRGRFIIIQRNLVLYHMFSSLN